MTNSTQPVAPPEFISGGRFLSRADLDRRALQAASGLESLGVNAGDSVALLLRNDFAFFEATNAARALGAYVVPMNWHLAPDEIAYVLSDCDARVLIAHSDLLHSCANIIPDTLTVLAVNTPDEIRGAYRLDDGNCHAPSDTLQWDEWLSGFPELGAISDSVPESMFYTSGTTGLPKGVKRGPPTAAGAAHILKIRDMIYGLKPGVRAVVPGPLYHGAPNQYGVRASQVADQVVLMPRFDAEGLLALIEEHQITNAFLVPVMFARMLNLPSATRARYDLSSLRHVVTAGAPCPPDMKSRMIDWLGPIVHEFYGATELSYMTFCNSKDAAVKPGTVGRPVEGAVMKIFDNAGSEMPAGTPGQVYGVLDGTADFTYHKRNDDRRAIERDGLVTCGDVGFFDEDGYLFLCDRESDMVISGGVNIYPAEIESTLAGMPGVLDCAVFGIPDDEFGECVMGVVQRDPNGAAVTENDIRKYLGTRIAAFKVPRIIEFRDDLPRDDSGKIYKRRLRDPYWESAGRQI